MLYGENFQREIKYSAGLVKFSKGKICKLDL
jgi:hypothetical protein